MENDINNCDLYFKYRKVPQTGRKDKHLTSLKSALF